MSPLVMAAAAALFGSVIVLWVYGRLLAVEKQLYIRLWMWGWAVSAVRYLLLLLSVVFPESWLLSLLNYLSALPTGVLLLWGTYAFIGKPLPRVWLWGLALAAAWISVGFAAQLDFTLTTLPSSSFLAVTNIATGVLILRSRQMPGIGARVTGAAFVIWGLHRLNYPFLRPIAWFAPWGFLIAAGLELLIAVSALLVFFQRMHAQLAESEARYRSLFDNAAEGIFRTTLAGRVLFANTALVRMLGYDSLDELRQIHIPTDLYRDPAVRDRLIAEDQPLLLDNEFHWKKKNGEPLVVSVFARQVQDETTGETVYEGMVRDITAQKRAEAAEQAQRLLVETLHETTTSITGALDLKEVLRRILDSVAQLIPHDAANVMLIEDGVARVVGLRGYEQFGATDAVMAVTFLVSECANLSTIADSGQALIIADVQAYPGWIHVAETAWIRSYAGAPIRASGETIGFINLDSAQPNHFTQQQADLLLAFADQAAVAVRNARLYEAIRQQAARLEMRVAARTAELERERAQLTAILDAMSEGVIGVLMDEDGQKPRYRYINRALVEMTGYSADEWDPAVIFSGSDPTEFKENWQKMLNAVNQQGIWSVEAPAFRKDGTRFECALTVNAVRSADGRVVGSVSILRDISQEKALAEQKRRFVSSASHELRTPLTSLKTRLYLARRQPERWLESLDQLDAIADRLSQLVEDMLDLSRFERGVVELRRSPVVVQNLIGEVIELLQNGAVQKLVALQASLPEAPLSIAADQARLIQVVTNLVTNAINHTPPGGSITVSAGLSDDRRRAFIRVEDTGEGIDPEHLDHIFDPFYRASRSEKGLGLGLSICREIVTLHGGEITVESTVGKGSVFTVTLPAE